MYIYVGVGVGVGVCAAELHKWCWVCCTTLDWILHV